jgi:hypothetical protein
MSGRCRGPFVSPVCSFGRLVADVASVAGVGGECVAVGGQALLVGASGGGEGVGEQAEGDVVAERGPGPHLMLIQAEQVFALFRCIPRSATGSRRPRPCP